MKKILPIILPFLIVLILFIIIILSVQESLFFYPWHDVESYNKLLENEKFKEVTIVNNGKVLKGWFVNNTKNEKAPLLIFFGGNANNTSNLCMRFEIKNIFNYFENYNVLMVDYPGYGLSEGRPSDVTMFEAALSTYDYAEKLENVDKQNIVVLGYSIGTGVATYLASQRDVNGLILIAPYDRALSLYNDNLNIFYGPIKILTKYKFDSISYAKDINVLPLIFTSYKDEVINYKFSLNLAKYFKNEGETIVLDNTTHNGYFSETIVLEKIHEYLQKKIKTQD